MKISYNFIFLIWLIGCIMCIHHTHAAGTTVPVNRNSTLGSNATQLNSLEIFRVWTAQVSLGTPAQTFTLNLDTGSDVLGVYSAECRGTPKCPDTQQTAAFDLSKSSSGSIISCTDSKCQTKICDTNNSTCLQQVTYGDNSGFIGVVVSDVVAVGSLSSNNNLFVDITQATTGFEAPFADGIMGLAYPGLDYPPSVIDAIISQNNLPNTFYLGFGLASDLGVFTIGDADTNYYDSSAGFASLNVVQPGFYSVAATQLAVAGSVVSSSAADFGAYAIVDSGTEALVFPDPLYSSVQNYFQTNYCNLDCVCGSQSMFDGFLCPLDQSKIAQYPNITVSFNGGVSVTILPHSYLIPVQDPNLYRLSIANGGSITSNQTITILGDPFFRGHYIGFDRTNNKVLIATASPSLGATGSTVTGTQTTQSQGSTVVETTVGAAPTQAYQILLIISAILTVFFL